MVACSNTKDSERVVGRWYRNLRGPKVGTDIRSVTQSEFLDSVCFELGRNFVAVTEPLQLSAPKFRLFIPNQDKNINVQCSH